MSNSLEFYVGAYLEVQAIPMRDIRNKIGCPQCKKAIGKNGKFCPDCGAKLIMMEFKEEQEACIYTLLPEDEYLDVLLEAYRPGMIEGEGIILRGNTSRLGDCIDVDPDLPIAEITPQIIDDCLRVFSAHYRDIIETLRTRSKNIQLKFGAFCYYE